MNELAKRWTQRLFEEDSEIEHKIKTGTEMYRKGFGKFTLRDAEGNSVQNGEIGLKQKRHEYHFGCNAFMVSGFPEEEKNLRYEELFSELFNLAVIPLFWSDLEPDEGKPRFDKNSPHVYRRPAIDLALEFCEKLGITPKGHPLCWHLYQPEWLSRNTLEVAERYEQRFISIAERYGNRIKIWDVVNEAQTWPTNRFSLPENHVELMFKLAERYFPVTSKLTYNDNVIWYDYHGDSTPVYLLAKSIIDQGLPLRGLGLQYHMVGRLLDQIDKAVCPRNIYKCLDQYAKLNVPVNFSEVSVIGMDELGDGDAFQEMVAERLYRLWFSHPATDGIIWWNMVDNTGAWESSNKLKAGIVNFDLSPKPVFKTLNRLINSEWNTQTSISYKENGDNRFHGFYGTYQATIKTNHGTFEREIELSEFSDNNFEIVIPVEGKGSHV